MALFTKWEETAYYHCVQVMRGVVRPERIASPEEHIGTVLERVKRCVCLPTPIAQRNPRSHHPLLQESGLVLAGYSGKP